MKFVSVTRLRLCSLRFLPGFAWYAIRSASQCKQAEGNLHTFMRKDRGLVFWTITVWRDRAAALAFRNSGAHRGAMPKLADWCDEGTYVHWEQSGTDAPGLQLAHARLVAEGAVSRVRHPSPRHANRDFPAPKS